MADIAIEHGPVEIEDLPIRNGFSIVMLIYQEGISHLPGEGLVILTTAQVLPLLAAIVVSGAGHHIASSGHAWSDRMSEYVRIYVRIPERMSEYYVRVGLTGSKVLLSAAHRK